MAQVEDVPVPIKVYRYGCGKVPKSTRTLIAQQLALAASYRLMLWHCSRASRALYRERRCLAFPQLAQAEQELARQVEIFGVLDIKEHKSERKKLKVEIARLRSVCRTLCKELKEDPSFRVTVQADHDRELELRRALRGAISQLGLYSGSYLLVEAADKASRGGRRDPARPLFTGSGTLGVQIQGGISTETVLSPARNSWVSIQALKRVGRGSSAGSRTVCRYRLCSAQRKPVFVELPLMYHRDLPADAEVLWARLAVRRVGLRYTYAVLLTVKSEENRRTQFGAGDVVVCFNQDRVSYADAYQLDTVKTFEFDTRLDKVASLQSIRDRQRNAMVATLKIWAEDLDQASDWLLEELACNEGKASCRRLVRFVHRLQKEYKLPKRLVEAIQKWCYHENHLYQWQEDMRRSALLSRRDAYRCFAANLRRKYRRLVLDNRRLEQPIRKTFERNAVALSELKTCLKNSFGDDFVLETTGATCREMYEKAMQPAVENKAIA